MLDWVNDFGRKYSGLFGAFSIIITVASVVWASYQNRAAIRKNIERWNVWAISAISPEYRKAHRDRTIRKLNEELSKLKNFGHADEMETEAKLGWNLSNGLFNLTVLVCYAGLAFLIILIAFFVILERDPEAAGFQHPNALVVQIWIPTVASCLIQLHCVVIQLSRCTGR